MRSLVVLLAVSACGEEPTVEPLFPASYATSYTEVRNCRQSTEHDLHRIRVLTDAAATEPYQMRTAPFPAGAIVVKEEYDFGDPNCTGEIVEWTVMQKTATAERLGWRWQRVTADRAVETENDERCITCHTGCGEPPGGYAGTCTNPP